MSPSQTQHSHAAARLCILAALLFTTPVSRARTFEDVYGREIQAELVSHTGADAGSVTIEKDDKEFEVPLTTFSESDRKRIREWMRATPPTIRYSFRASVVKRAAEPAKAAGDTTTSDEDRPRGDDPRGGSDRRGSRFGSGEESVSWIAYDVKLVNLSRQNVAALEIEYRAYWMDHGGGEPRYFGFGGRRGSDTESREPTPMFVSDTIEWEPSLKFNEAAQFATKPVKLDQRKKSYRDYKDEPIGVIIRVRDSAGKPIFEYRDRRAREIPWDAGGDDDGGDEFDDLEPVFP